MQDDKLVRSSGASDMYKRQVLNLMTFLKVKNNMLNKTINHIGTGFPFLMTFVFMLSLIFYFSLFNRDKLKD